jgi:MFS family permease
MDSSVKPLYSNRYRGYVLLILTGVYTFNFIDRQILVILQESIKGELGLSDTQLGMLTGLTFALFYVTLGIPIARLADKGNRRNIVAISLALWSIMTAVSGLATNFVQLLLARIGVGVGEAGGSPPAHSMISDYFPPEKRATALSIYSVGIYIGILIGYLAGGWINQFFGWRMALMALGIPGVVYALILLFTVKEPPKGHSDEVVANSKDNANSFWEVIHILFSKKTFIFVALGSGIHTFANYGVGNFYAPFLARVHQMPIGQIGTWLGITTGFGGMIGTFLGGYLGDKFSARDVRWYLWLPVIAEIINFVPSIGAFFSDNTSFALFCYFLTAMLTAVYLGPCIAVTHNLVDAHKRALASAILFLVLNLIGLGIGPLAIGYLSDLLAPTYGVESLRYAFCFTFLTGFISMVLFYFGAKHYPNEYVVRGGASETEYV